MPNGPLVAGRRRRGKRIGPRWARNLWQMGGPSVATTRNPEANTPARAAAAWTAAASPIANESLVLAGHAPFIAVSIDAPGPR
jgi:hypothetical protein